MTASWASAIALTIERPRPSPFASAVRAVSSRWNGSKIRSSSPAGNHSTVIGDGEKSSAVPALGCQLDATARGVVADRVRDEVRDEPFDETRIARRLGRSEVLVEDESVVACGPRGSGGDRGEVDGLVAAEAALAAGEREQGFDQAFLLLADGEQLLAGVPVGVDARVGVAERELEQGAFERERGAQFVRGVGDELPLRVEGRFETCEQSIERGAELLELVVGPLESEPAVEVAGGDLASGVGDRAQRTQGAAGDHPAEPDREHGHDRERDRGVDEQLVPGRVRLSLRRGGRELRAGHDRIRADRHAETDIGPHLHVVACFGQRPLPVGRS